MTLALHDTVAQLKSHLSLQENEWISYLVQSLKETLKKDDLPITVENLSLDIIEKLLQIRDDLPVNSRL